ncbi:acyl-CoA dehydrogenase family protein [Nocardia brasiliensis]|uniref:Acyl-CoA dehydrogenase n=1 Tax=Nocardia brasiliensis (strain ATCC 700358 / HUJEG-1) TaxID=1133849 RepID=K0EW66_NOCB7|nr:acyl-CoA dehydrogenase family protein [Nocardia brasiliensis]AFU01289.1 acyl-CoA dehydrogenase [Nocardia brasiliensis ATCC 700358]OCF86642.1 acyl-CoA dehydrogenase [Nocardia brasiliensis]
MTTVGQLVDKTTQFIRDQVVPVEREVVVDGRVMDDALRLDLQKKAKEAGVFGPLSDQKYGGLGLDTRAQAQVLEAAGASLLGPLAVNAWAPDDGNIHLLAHVADAEQQQRYLAPLAAGDVRSAIAMTEPAPGAGSDPGMLQTVAEETDSGWVINGAKHFTTGAQGAAFTICVARTTEGPTMFLVDQDNPGLRVGRRMPTLDHTSAPGGHCEVTFVDCEVPDAAVLGAVGQGLALAQVRLAPSRLVFCMNWLGLAVRAHHLAIEHISTRTSFGVPIADHGLAQGMVADNEIDIAAARGIIRTAAETIDAQGPTSSQARHDASIAKTFVSEAVWRVLDRAVQLHGGLGVCEDYLVARFLVEARAFRIYEGPSEVLRWSIARRALRNR